MKNKEKQNISNERMEMNHEILYRSKGNIFRKANKNSIKIFAENITKHIPASKSPCSSIVLYTPYML